MGARKEARDKAHTRAQFDAEAAGSRFVRVDRYYLQRVEDDLAASRAAEAKLRRDLARCTLRLRERAATLTSERAAKTAERDALERRAHGAERSMLAFRRRWEYVSRLLRQFPADQVRALRTAEHEGGVR